MSTFKLIIVIVLWIAGPYMYIAHMAGESILSIIGVGSMSTLLFYLFTSKNFLKRKRNG